MSTAERFKLINGLMNFKEGREKIKEKIDEERGERIHGAQPLSRYVAWKLLELAGFAVYGIYHAHGFGDCMDVMHVGHKKEPRSVTLVFSCVVNDYVNVTILGDSEDIKMIAKILELDNQELTYCVSCSGYWCSYREIRKATNF